MATVAQRGVMAVASAHGTDLASLLRNPQLNPLLGGVQQAGGPGTGRGQWGGGLWGRRWFAQKLASDPPTTLPPPSHPAGLRRAA